MHYTIKDIMIVIEKYLHGHGSKSAPEILSEMTPRFTAENVRSALRRGLDHGLFELDERMNIKAAKDDPDAEEWKIETIMFDLVNSGNYLPEYEPYMRKLWAAYCEYQQFSRDATLLITNHIGGGSEMFSKELHGIFLADLDKCSAMLNRNVEAATKRGDGWRTIAQRHQQEIIRLQQLLHKNGIEYVE